jgi:hypothetical protein
MVGESGIADWRWVRLHYEAKNKARVWAHEEGWESALSTGSLVVLSSRRDDP